MYVSERVKVNSPRVRSEVVEQVAQVVSGVALCVRA